MGDLENAAVSRPGGYRLQIRAAEARSGCISRQLEAVFLRRSGVTSPFTPLQTP